MNEIALPIETTAPRRWMRRRRYVIDRRRQFRAATLTSGLAILLLIVVNTAFSILRTSQSEVLSVAAPQLRTALEEQDARLGMLLIVVSAIVVTGVFVITIAETHRTAGAAFALKQRLNRVRDGDYRVTLKLRPRDTLLDLRDPFNEMVGSLRETALADADRLDRLADAAREDSDLAAELRAFAEEKRANAG
jgi:methyl-accepting chemotaxis protein